MNRQSRRQFLGGAAALAATGCTAFREEPLPRFAAKGEIKAFLLHLGHNMWCDWYPPEVDPVAASEAWRKSTGAKLTGSLPVVPDTKLRNRDDYWRQVTDAMAAKGLNMLVVDIGEGLVFPSHPELAIEGSWSPGKLRAEIRRLNALGIEVIPKLNFSTTHNGWLGPYRRMLSTPVYYRVCEDLIRDVAEIFETPRFMHIGYDEETAEHQNNSGRMLYLVVRKGEIWKYDFLHIVKTVEKNGMRAWAWNDYGWDHPEFYEWCPRSVLMNSWYYDECHGGFELAENRTADHKRLRSFYDLDKAGFEQVPCGTNWTGWKRRKEGCGADDVIGRLVKTMRRDLDPKSLKGFMMAPWASLDTPDHLAFNLKGLDLFAEALRS